MSGWETMTLAKAGVRLIDCVHKTPQAQPSGYPYVAIPQMKDGRIDFADARRISEADYVEWTKKAKHQTHDVILSRRTNPGVIATSSTETPFALGQNLVLLRADGRKVLPQFLRWLCLSPDWWQQVEKFINVGAVFSSLRCGDVPNFELPIPPKNEQEAIAATLSALDDKIELNRRMNETLEGMAQAIFKDWFVDFGPTRRKLAGISDPVAIMGSLTPDAARANELVALFPDAIGDDGLPMGWIASTLGKHMVNFDSKRVPVSGAVRAKRKGVFPYHGATGIMDYVDDYLFDGIYLLVGEDGSVVKESGLAFTQYVWGKIWVNNHAHVLQGKDGVSTEQLFLYFSHEPVEPFITGAVQLKLSQGRMNSMPFLDAGKPINSAFFDLVSPLFARLRAATVESRTLAETRDYLLPKLMSGEVRVRASEPSVE